MSAKNSPKKKTVERKFRLTRIFDAPRSLVFAAWTEAKHLKRWSAPHGFTIPESEGDLRVGGAWRACMCPPDGTPLWLSGVYREIIKDELLVFTHAWEDGQGRRDHETIVTVRFADHDGKTKVTLDQSGFDSDGSAEGHKGGWTECLERLADLLAELQTGKRNRVHNGK